MHAHITAPDIQTSSCYLAADKHQAPYNVSMLRVGTQWCCVDVLAALFHCSAGLNVRATDVLPLHTPAMKMPNLILPVQLRGNVL